VEQVEIYHRVQPFQAVALGRQFASAVCQSCARKLVTG
jgi:hypothetical protein